jgi:sulfate adenylyltransferase
MKSLRKNKELFIDKEALATLSMAKEGILNPVTKLMSKEESLQVDATKKYKGKTFPFSFILAPAGKRNQKVLKSIRKNETIDLITENKKVGEIVAEEIFEIDPIKRIKNIYGTDDLTHPGVQESLKRVGKYAVYGEYNISFDEVKKSKETIKKAKKKLGAKTITAIMMAAKPFHRAHERLIRISLENSDLVVIFLLKPYKKDDFSFELRFKTLQFFIDNFLPKNRVVVVPLENTYIFAGYNEVIIDAIVAQNFGCTKLIIGQNHAGVGLYYDKNSAKSIFDTLKGMDIKIEIISEFVYCNVCKTLVSSNTCPHGSHHHIQYHSKSILELLKEGIAPPAVLVRKEISALILSSLFPKRFKNLEQLFCHLFPCFGIVDKHTEKEFYEELINLYQTTSLT